MTKPTKETIFVRVFHDGVQKRETIEERVVHRPDGKAPYVRGHRGRYVLTTDPDGTLVLRHDITTIQKRDAAQTIGSILGPF